MTFTFSIINLLFKRLLLFWIILALLELIMPGFSVFYVPMNFLLLIVCILGTINLFQD